MERIDPGQLDLAHFFQVAIYESLIEELNKTHRFKYVFREGDSKASDDSQLADLDNDRGEIYAWERNAARSDNCERSDKVKRAESAGYPRWKDCARSPGERECSLLRQQFARDHNLARNIAKAITKSDVAMDPSIVPRNSAANSENADGMQCRAGPLPMCNVARGGAHEISTAFLIAIAILGTVWHTAAAQPKKKNIRSMRLRRRDSCGYKHAVQRRSIRLIALKPEMPLGPQDILKSYEIAMSIVAEKTSADLSVIVQAQQTNQITREQAEYLLQQRYQMAMMQYQVLSALHDVLKHDIDEAAGGRQGSR